MQNIQLFMLNLGKGFLFIGCQSRQVVDEDEHITEDVLWNIRKEPPTFGKTGPQEMWQHPIN